MLLKCIESSLQELQYIKMVWQETRVSKKKFRKKKCARVGLLDEQYARTYLKTRTKKIRVQELTANQILRTRFCIGSEKNINHEFWRKKVWRRITRTSKRRLWHNICVQKFTFKVMVWAGITFNLVTEIIILSQITSFYEVFTSQTFL